MSFRLRVRATLFLLTTVFGVAVLQMQAGATNGAHFTSLSAQMFADDLRVSFTEAGIGNDKIVDIEVTATRKVEVVCVSGLGEFVVGETLPVAISVGQNDSADLQFTHQETGRLLTGEVWLRTNFHDNDYVEGTDPPHEAPVCPRYDPQGILLPEFILAMNYSVTYTDVTVTDHENGGASDSKQLDDSYHHSIYGGFSTFDFELVGISCTIEDEFSGHCEGT